MRASQMRLVTVMVLAGTCAFFVPNVRGEPPKDPKSQPEMKLPPGWTEEDMKACMMAAVPGEMHQFLAKGVGVWRGKMTMWDYPGAVPSKSDSIATVTSIMEGHYTLMEATSDMPGMGPFKGLCIFGFDNVSQKFVSTWIDNFGTGMMNGTGELSADRKVLTWDFTFNCPITRKPAIMRETETVTGPDSRIMEMFGPDPKTGKEFKMVTIEYTRTEKKAPAVHEQASESADSPVDLAELKVMQDMADAAKLQVDAAAINLAQIEIELKRYQSMFDKKAIAENELQKAKLEVALAQIRSQMAMNQWTLRKDEIAARKARIEEKKQQQAKH